MAKKKKIPDTGSKAERGRDAIAAGNTVTDTVADAVPEMVTDTMTAQAFVDSHQNEDTSELFGITQLCTEFGITQRTLRFYEDKELITPRRINNNRVYSRRDRARLALILRAKAIGSSLEEIKHYLDLYGAHGEGRVQQLGFVVAKTDKAIAELETKRAQIDATLAELRLINQTSRRQMEQASLQGKVDG